jgi:hypothetical protein
LLALRLDQGPVGGAVGVCETYRNANPMAPGSDENPPSAQPMESNQNNLAA